VAAAARRKIKWKRPANRKKTKCIGIMPADTKKIGMAMQQSACQAMPSKSAFEILSATVYDAYQAAEGQRRENKYPPLASATKQ
jgi:hypothetical protein